MKNANPSVMTSLRLVLPLLSVLVLASLHETHAQLATCNNDTSIANFGVNRMVYVQGVSTVDDWFRLATASGTGQGVIGTSAQTAKPPLQVSAATFRSLIQSATTVTGRNRTYVQGMAVPSLTIWNNMLLLDAFAARDNMSSSGALDSTVFSGGGDKNADNPNTWALGVGGVQQKSDIIDVAGHIRRDLSTGDLWCFAMASILSPGGDNFIDFEYFRSSPVISGGILTNTGLSSAGNHTPFLLNSTGGIQSPGDVLAGLTYSLSSGSATLRIWIDPKNVNGAGLDTAWYNQLPNRLFTFTGNCIYGLNSGTYGYAEIRSITAGSCLVYSVVNNNTTSSGEWGTLSGSNAAFATSFVSEQMVEIAINFSDFGLDLNSLSGACFNVFGSLLVKTRSSSSVTSELKDFAGPFQFGNLTEVQADAGSDKVINCANSTVTLNGSSLTPGAVFSWTTPNGQILIGGNTFNPTVATPGTYILTVASPSIATCVTSDTVVVTLDTIRPVANAGGDWNFDCNSAATRTLNGSSPSSGVDPLWTALSGGSIINNAATFNPVVSSTGCYVLTVTNPVSLCSNSDTVCSITQTDVPVITATQIVQPSCSLSCNASVSLSVNGATGPYTFLWSDGQSGPNRSGLCAGSYQVTVTSANGCTSVFGVTMIDPDELIASSGGGIVPVSCSGGNNGAATISVTGGTAPYAGIGVYNGLSAGNYTYTVTDANGCTSSVAVAITEPTPVVLSLVSNSPALCKGDNSGELVVEATGGVEPYTYTWSTNTIGSVLSGVPAGNYTVLLTDANGCSQTATYTITEPPAALSTSANITKVGCYNGSTGAIDLTPAGGTAPYTYSWSTGATTQDVSNLPAGAYIVTVTDDNGCEFTAVYNVDEPLAALSATDVVTDVACHGGSTGLVSLSVTGGTLPYTYIWSNGSSMQDLSGVSAGVYTVTVSDANGCLFNRVVNVGQPAVPLSSTANPSIVSCFGGSDGQIDLTPAGGTAPYQYQWNNSSISQDIFGLQAGTYTVLITDSVGCTYQQSVQVAQPSLPVTATASTVSVSCFGGGDGQIDLSVNGGTAPYTYQWNNGSTTEDLVTVSAGAYTVTVTDSQNCVFNQTVTVGQPQASVNATASTNAVDCFGGNNGQIDLSPSGGTAPYTFLWSNGSTLEDQSGLSSGTYNVLVTDANGCTLAQSVQVAQPPAPIAATTVTVNVGCKAGATGQIDLTVSGGTAPYTFLWSNGSTSEDLQNLIAGFYTVTITDANNCTFTQVIDINQPGASVVAQSVVTNVDCYGFATGQIDLTTIGGVSPYNYQWSNGVNTEDQSGLVAGTYTVLITDANNCTFSQSITITQPVSALDAATTTTDVDCHGSASGAIDLTPSGGTAPYIFQWNNGVITEDQGGLVAGVYTVQITDANNCVFSTTVVVDEPAIPLNAGSLIVDVACHGDASGSIDLTSSGGSSPYTFQWSNGSASEDQSGLSAGSYDVVVTDNNGCSFASTYTINEPSAPLSSSNTVVNVDCNGNASGQIDLSVTGGTAPYTYLWSNGSTTEDQPALSAGAYSVVITDANNCTSSTSVSVGEPAAVLAASSSATPVGCNGDATGQIDLTPSGGTSPYTYSWSNGSSMQDISGLSAGTYSVTITDVNGCTTVHLVQVAQPQNALQANGTSIAADCINGTLGTVTVTPLGGTAPFTYQWNNGFTSFQMANLVPGSYQVTVTDANGCTANETLTVADSSDLVIQANGSTEICVGDSVTISAPQLPNATYQWLLNGVPLQGANSNTFSTPVNGVYQAVVTTSCGPYTSNPVSITLRTVENVSINNDVIICTGETTQLQVTGGSSYSWSPAGSLDDPTSASPVASPRQTTNYVVTITDDSGCSTTASVTVTVECDTLNVPNGFSPNGDGKNDTFVIDGLEQFPGTVLNIFNRWGNLVYKQKDYANEWNGTSNVGNTIGGNELPNGTYYYILDLNKGEKPLTGFVVIRR